MTKSERTPLETTVMWLNVVNDQIFNEPPGTPWQAALDMMEVFEIKKHLEEHHTKAPNGSELEQGLQLLYMVKHKLFDEPGVYNWMQLIGKHDVQRIRNYLDTMQGRVVSHG